MSQPASPEQSDAVVEEVESEAAVELDDEAPDEEAPLNRAARRAKAKGNDPSHVGPQSGRTDQGRGPRSHTKRQIG